MKKEGRKEVGELSAGDILDLLNEKAAREFLRRNKVGRNKPCPCGSGRKFKHCCMRELK